MFAAEAGRGPFRFFLVPGLVPDGAETFLRQRALFLAYGSVTTLTYPYDDFPLDAVVDGLGERVRRARAAGELPVLVGVSVGGGLCLEALRRARVAGAQLPLAGCILVSPFTCTGDLAPLLKRLVDPILAAGAADEAELALERGRAFFQQLATRSVAAVSPSGWRRGLSLLTPSGLRARSERGILARIERTLSRIPAHGALARVVGLRDLPGLAGIPAGPVSTAPTQILWGSKERQTLTMEGPGTGVLCRPDLACRTFAKVEVQWVYGPGGEDVPHASLLRHAHAFNPHLKRFLRRLKAGLGPLPSPATRVVVS